MISNTVYILGVITDFNLMIEDMKVSLRKHLTGLKTTNYFEFNEDCIAYSDIGGSIIFTYSITCRRVTTNLNLDQHYGNILKGIYFPLVKDIIVEIYNLDIKEIR
jgi:hypothetical protein